MNSLSKRKNNIKEQEKTIYMAKTQKIGRRADNGRFVPVETAKKHPKTQIVETIKKGPRK